MRNFIMVLAMAASCVLASQAAEAAPCGNKCLNQKIRNLTVKLQQTNDQLETARKDIDAEKTALDALRQNEETAIKNLEEKDTQARASLSGRIDELDKKVANLPSSGITSGSQVRLKFNGNEQDCLVGGRNGVTVTTGACHTPNDQSAVWTINQ